jgi:hypothetical protein
MFKTLIIVGVLISSCLNAKGIRHLYLDSPHYIGGAGLFHNFNIVLGCLDLYDRYDYLGLTVDFKTEGLYYEEAYGSNWWNYYFEPIDLPARQAQKGAVLIKYLKDEEKGALGNGAHFYMNRERAYALITRYIRVRQEILQEVNEFYSKYLNGAFLIGVHYRGTDKNLEAEDVSYSAVADKVREYVAETPYKIFVATDEPEFLHYMQEEFVGTVYAIDAQRIAGKPVHYTSKQCFLKGKEALMDCLLLAHAHLLIRTHSNLSAVTAYFNPEVPVINLNTLSSILYQGLLQYGVPNELNAKP